MAIVQETGFIGANSLTHRRFLEPGVGVASLNQKPSEEGDFRPWRVPLTISGPVIPSGRQTIYRLGRATISTTDFWLSWTTVVHAIRGFDTTDPTERTYFTGSGTPKVTDNTIGLSSAPLVLSIRKWRPVAQLSALPTASPWPASPSSTASPRPAWRTRTA